MDKKGLAITLSKLEINKEFSRRLEQYPTPPEIAAQILWMAQKDIVGKQVVDFGSGNGIFAIGCSLLGAKKVFGVEIDKDAFEVSERNAKKLDLEVEFTNESILEFSKNVDTVIMNPPFGSKGKSKDRIFLEKAMATANVIYSIHKIESDKFISSLSNDNGFESELVFEFDFRINPIMDFHKKRSHDIKCGCWKIKKSIKV